MLRRTVWWVGAGIVAVAGAIAAPTASPVGRSTPAAVAAVVRYAPPVPGRVLRRFDPPAGPYGPGHLGVDLDARAGTPVRAAAAGRVRFAGRVAGRGVVVLEHADGVRTEYEPVTPLVQVGATVARGQPVGVLSGTHRGCSGPCLHWGARRGDAYLDPLGLLGPLGAVRLMPWP